MSREIRPLVGPNSLRVVNVCGLLLMGYQMIRQYNALEYEAFYAAFADMPDDEKENILRKAVHLVKVEPEEIEAVISFATDANGVAYSKSNIKNLRPDELFEIIVAVCMEVSRIKIDLVTPAEKKK